MKKIMMNNNITDDKDFVSQIFAMEVKGLMNIIF